VFYGAGGASVGLDLKYVSSLNAAYPLRRADIATARPGGNGGEFHVARWGLSSELDKPVIAAIEGPAVAGGMELDCGAISGNARVYFGVYCRRWGVPLIDGAPCDCAHCGQGRALEIILTGRKVPAEECMLDRLVANTSPEGRSTCEGGGSGSEIARFPQVCVRADRRSAIKTMA